MQQDLPDVYGVYLRGKGSYKFFNDLIDAEVRRNIIKEFVIAQGYLIVLIDDDDIFVKVDHVMRNQIGDKFYWDYTDWMDWDYFSMIFDSKKTMIETPEVIYENLGYNIIGDEI